MGAPPLGGSFRGVIHTIVGRHRRELLRMERDGAGEMVRAYGEIWKRVSVGIEQLATRYFEVAATNDEISPSWVFEFNRLQNLQRQVEAELRTFANFAEARIVRAQYAAVEAAAQHLQEIVTASAGPGVHVRWDRLPAKAVEDLVGFTRDGSPDGSPLRELLDELGPDASRAVRDGLIQGLALGHSPRKVARAIRGELGGNLVRALKISRTECLRSYREATRRNYQANSDIIAGWRWLCAKQTRVCAMCLAMDGTFHTLEEHLDDHPNGRCTMVPVLKDEENKPPPWETGSDWLAKQSPEAQAQILGQAGAAAYRAGAVQLTDYVGQRRSKEWGSTRYARSLRDILGDDEARKWIASARAPRPIAPVVPESLPIAERAVVAIEERIRRNTFESLYAVDNQGATILEKVGGQYEVLLSAAEQAQLQGLIVTHNHPRALGFTADDPRSMGNSFSPEDIAVACRAQVAEMRAVSPELRYRMGPPPGGWNEQYWNTTLEPCYNRHAAAVENQFGIAIARRTMSLENAGALHYHEIWKRVAKELGLDYRVEYG